jgi:O-antigen ligase
MQASITTKSEYLLFASFLVSIYISTSASTILSAFIGIQWLFSGRFRGLPNLLIGCPVCAWSLSLLGIFFLGLIYSSATLQEGLAMINKYREFFFIPVFISFLGTRRARDWLWNAFMAASTVSLLGSYLMFLGIFDLNKQGDACFKSRITYSIFIAFFAFVCAHKFYLAQKYRALYLLAVVLCLYNLFFIVQGRTGEMILVSLAILFAWQRFNGKCLVVSVLAIAMLLFLFVNFSDKANRLQEGFENTQAYLKPSPEQVDSSMGLRLGFWKNSLILMNEKPLLGHGTGSFEKEYRRLVADRKLDTANPHNEFMMIGVQLGILGLMVYGGFLWSQYRCANLLQKEQKWLANGLLLTLLVTSVFNSPFLDHAEGHWFACMIALCFGSLNKRGIQATGQSL